MMTTIYLLACLARLSSVASQAFLAGLLIAPEAEILRAVQAQLPGLESRTMLTGPRDASDTEILLTERVTGRDGFILATKSVLPDENIAYVFSSYDNQGIPIQSKQEGQWNDRWNVFETTYGSEECVQSINGKVTKKSLAASDFANPTTLWFWKTHPDKGTSVTVQFLAQNTLATYEIQFTYEDDEIMDLAGRKVTLHRVRETPLGAPPEVYTLWWYDDQGMGVKRYHKTTQGEYRIELLAWR